MTNLFSIFDPSTSINFSFNWISLILPLIIIPKQYWLKKSKNLIFWIIINNFLFKELNRLKKNKIFRVINLLTLFFIILIINFLGIFPYIFTPSRHLSITLSLSLSLWLRIIIYNWFKYTIDCLAHLVPLNTPPLLIIFIVLIETIRTIIRPITLAIRLSANIIAGHLLLCLLGSCGPLINLNLIFLIYIVQIILFILEIAVAIIQSYVFITLISLYYNEL